MRQGKQPFTLSGLIEALLLFGLLGTILLAVSCDSMSSPEQVYAPTRTLLVQTGPTAPGTLPELLIRT